MPVLHAACFCWLRFTASQSEGLQIMRENRTRGGSYAREITKDWLHLAPTQEQLWHSETKWEAAPLLTSSSGAAEHFFCVFVPFRLHDHTFHSYPHMSSCKLTFRGNFIILIVFIKIQTSIKQVESRILILRPRWWERHVDPKRRLTFNGQVLSTV